MDIEFYIKVKIKDRWIPHFLSMLNYMQSLGEMGSSRKVCLFADGDGDFRPKFEPSIPFSKVKPIKDDNGNRLYDAG